MSTDPTRIEPAEQPPASDHTAAFSTDTPQASQSPQTQSDTRAESGGGATGEFSQTHTRVEASGPNATANFTTGPTGRRASAVLQTSLGGYEILGELGRGGMGVVYKAHQRGLNRVVALKMVLAGGHASEDQLKRFLIEARAVAHLQHQNIVQVFDIGENDGLPFFSLEYVDGDPLSKKLAKQPQPPKEAAQMLETLAKAMQYAHDNKIIHRDLKPANILLTSTGVPKIADFGLAKQIEDADDGGATRTGTVIGTPSYMAPEQARGDTHIIGPPTDQYALGAMLYEMLTGRPPFAAARQVDTILQVIKNEPIPPHQLVEKIPADLETICLKALQKDIAKRYASCGEFAEDLGRYLRGEPILARPVGNVERAIRWCKRNPLVASLSAVAVASLIIVTCVSTWSAMTLSAKNTLLAEETARANLNAENEKKQADIAKSQTTIAEEKKAEAEKQAKNLENYIKDFIVQVRSIDDVDAPQVRPARDRLLNVAIASSDEVVKQLEKRDDEQAIPTKMALDHALVGAYRDKNQSAKSGESIQRLVKTAESRIEKKQGSDASRNNLVLFLMMQAENKRDHERDLAASLALGERAHKLAQEILANPKTDQLGLGRSCVTDARGLLAETTAAIATTHYRLGDPYTAEKHFRAALELISETIKNIDSDELFKKKPPADQERIRKTLPTFANRQALAIGSTLFRVGKPDDAEPYLTTAFKQAEAAWKANPRSAQRRLSYIGIASMRAEFIAQAGRTMEALPLLESTAKLADEAIAFDPDGSLARRTSALAYYRLAQWRDESGMGDAAEMFTKALSIRAEMSNKDPANERRKIEYAMAVGRTGDFAKVDELTQELLKNPNADSEMLLELARANAQASRACPEDRKSEFLSKSVVMVKRAADQKFRDLVYLEKEIDFKPLWELPEFKAITAEIRAANAAIADVAPPEVK